MKPYFEIFGTTIAAGNLFLILGMVAMLLCFVVVAIVKRIKWYKPILLTLWVNLWAILGAKILYIFENWHYVIANGITFGGFSFFGTVFLLPIILPLTYKLFFDNRRELLDLCAMGVLAELAVYRLGCHFQGCCGGKIASWGLAFADTPDVLRIPVQLIEVGLDLALLAVFVVLFKKNYGKGQFYAIFMVGYGTIRFAIEFLRINTVLAIGITLSQVFALISVLIGAMWLNNFAIIRAIISKAKLSHTRRKQ